MTGISWSNQKNRKLIHDRNISFEDVVLAIVENRVTITPHPNPKFAHQNIFYFEHNHYYYACPFVISGQGIFLKTIYPSRKAKKIIKEAV